MTNTHFIYLSLFFIIYTIGKNKDKYLFIPYDERWFSRQDLTEKSIIPDKYETRNNRRRFVI